MSTDEKYSEILSQYPEYISKDQMYVICHISKRTAQRLLQSGLIPCTDSGKLTRKYTIKTVDVVEYLRDREVNPEKYRIKANSLYACDVITIPSAVRNSEDYIERTWA